MNECPVTVRGQYFPSQKAAAAHLGVTASAVANGLMRHGHCDRVGVGFANLGNTNAKSVPVEVGPFRFRSQISASKELGVSRTSIRRFCSGRYTQLIIRVAMEKFDASELKEFLKENQYVRKSK